MIDGQILTVGGYESEEYLQSIANYVNRKIDELNGLQGYRRMSADLKKAMIAINIADDYFKAKERLQELEEDIENRNRDAYELKNKLVAAGIEIEKLKKEVARGRYHRGTD